MKKYFFFFSMKYTSLQISAINRAISVLVNLHTLFTMYVERDTFFNVRNFDDSYDARFFARASSRVPISDQPSH